MKHFLTLLAALSVFVLISCILGGDKVAGRRGSEVENELGVYGVLVREDGTPVAGAKVKVSPSGLGNGKRAALAAGGDSDSVFTNDLGKYAFQGLDSGAYSLLGDFNSGSLVMLRTGIHVADTGLELNLGVDTLRPPGLIGGRLLLGDKGKPAVLCYIPGTSYLSVSDDSGRFLISGIPKGRYSVGYSANGFLISPDTGVLVNPAQTTELPDKHLEYDSAFPPPAPTGLKAVYDTLAERVTLTWDAVPVSDLEGFVVYRDAPGFAEPVPLPGGFTSRTGFLDTSIARLGESEKRMLTYRIKARDKEANVSASFSAPITVEAVSRKWVASTLEIRMTGKAGIESSVGDSLVFVLDYSNPTRNLVSWSWSLEGEPAPLRKSQGATKVGSDTLVWVAGSLGQKRMLVTSLDAGGEAWNQIFDFRILADPPMVSAMPDTQLTLNDSLVLRGNASDRFGRIVSWAWDVGGDGNFIGAEQGILPIKLPSESGNLRCVLRVTDDDGNSATDTLQVRIIADAPRAFAFGDTTVSIKDMVVLTGSGKDGEGSIVKLEWDVGGKGDFRTASGPIFQFTAGSSAGDRIPCVLKVTDDDGQSDLDTVLVTVLLDPPIANAGADTVVTPADPVHLRGSGSDKLGRVERFAWDIGATGSFSGSKADTSFPAPTEPGRSLLCILRITDDDGNADFDTTVVATVSDKPRAFAFGDTTVSIKDRIDLKGAGVDSAGSIVKLEWDIGGKQAFQSAAGADYFFFAGSEAAEALACILRVTDDDGEMAMDTVYVRIVKDPPAAFAGKDTLVTPLDGISLRGSGKDGIGRIVKWEWDAGATGHFAASGPDTLVHAPKDPISAFPCVLRVTDDDGNTALDTLNVEVAADAPHAEAGADTIVSILDRVVLRGKGSDGSGRVVGWEWDIGATGVFKPGGSDTAFNAPAGVRDIPCVLRVTDDDGQTATDVLIVKVVLDPPEARITTDMSPSGFVNDSLRLSGNMSEDLFGTVVKWEWDIGGEGDFVNSDGPDFTGTLPAVPQKNMSCVLRVTDDDGNTGLDTFHLDVLAKGGSVWAKSAATVPFSGRVGQASVVFQGRIWVVAGKDSQVRNDVWSSLDGENWTLSNASAAFSPREFPTCVAFNDRLWLIGGRLADGGYLSDVWSSADGVIWEKATDAAGFEPYYLMRSCVFNGKMWVLWGEDFPNGPKEYLWSSSDGVNWAPEAGPISQPRISKQFLLSRDGQMWIRGSDFTLYVTSDGKNWSQPAWDPTFPNILFPAALDLKGTLLVTGANPVSGAMEIWRLPMAGPPLLVVADVPFVGWGFPTSTVFKDKMWLMKSGSGSSGGVNSIWYSE